MSRPIAVGIDVGTHQIKVAVGTYIEEGGKHLPKILATGLSVSEGVHHGYLIEPKDAVSKIKEAITKTEKALQIMPTSRAQIWQGGKIQKAFVSVGAIGLQSIIGIGTALISKADLEISQSDIDVSISEAERLLGDQHKINRKILHRIPIQFKIDGR